jgi:hypothetical protein
MHDPMTVAFQIPGLRRNDCVYPGYRPPLITVWHVDPESDGSDNSCDWWGTRLTSQECELVASHAEQEHSFFFDYDVAGLKGASPIAIIWAAYRSVKWGLYREKELSPKEICLVFDLAACPTDNLRCYALRSPEHLESFESLFILLARQAKKIRRPWYRHPRWHVHHWKIQFHAWERLYRWLFVRCAHCGERLTKGSPHVRGDELYHGHCLNARTER